VPFTPGQLAEAMSSVARPVQWPQPWQVSTLRAAPPQKSSNALELSSAPLSGALELPEPQTAIEAPRDLTADLREGSRALTAAPVPSTGLSVQLHVGVERQRFFWWRMALSLVVRRLR
jgi:hypothetical protein